MSKFNLKTDSRELVTFYLIAAISGLIALGLQLNFLIGTLVFPFLPIAYLAWKRRANLRKDLVQSLIWSVPMSFLIDLLGHLNKS